MAINPPIGDVFLMKDEQVWLRGDLSGESPTIVPRIPVARFIPRTAHTMEVPPNRPGAGLIDRNRI